MMTRWLKIKEVANELGLSENFVRTVICQPVFESYCCFEKPIMIKFNDSFKKIIMAYANHHSIRRNRPKKTEEIKKEHKISMAGLRFWTQSAIDCYNIDCNCEKCFLHQVLNSECKMYEVVSMLIRKFGKPSADLLKDFY